MDFSNILDDILSVVSHPLLFKTKLGVGEDAYKSLKIKNNLFKLLDVYGAGAAGASAAGSATVANSFFASKGVLAILGFGTAATPIGWVVAAALASGGAYYGFINLLGKHTDSKVTVVPKFINTPLDLLAVGVFDLVMPLCLKVAYADGVFSPSEREHIVDYFVYEWGYDAIFINNGIDLVEQQLPQYSIETLAKHFSKFTKDNPDCNQDVMVDELVSLLQEISKSDGEVCEQEKMAIEYVEKHLKSKESVFSKMPKMPDMPDIGGAAKKLIHKKFW